MRISSAPRVSTARERGFVAAAVACGSGLVIWEAGVPGGPLLAGLVVGIALALAAPADVRVAPRMYTAAQALLGGAIGSLAQSGLNGSGPMVLLLPVIIAATVILSLAAGELLARHARIGRATALLGMVPGGSGAVVASADEMGADARVVAVLQYLRIGLVAATAPLIAYLLLGAPAHQHAVYTPSLKDYVVGIAIVGCIALAGPWLGRRVRMPTAALAGPMVLGVVLGWAGAFHDAPVHPTVTAVALAVIGLEIGLRFDHSTLRSLSRIAPAACGLSAAIMLACASLGEIFSLLTGTPAVDGYLMTTPGGINAVLGAAVSMPGINVALVAVAQILRLLTMILVVPALVRRLTRAPNAAV